MGVFRSARRLLAESSVLVVTRLFIAAALRVESLPAGELTHGVFPGKRQAKHTDSLLGARMARKVPTCLSKKVKSFPALPTPFRAHGGAYDAHCLLDLCFGVEKGRPSRHLLVLQLLSTCQTCHFNDGDC